MEWVIHTCLFRHNGSHAFLVEVEQAWHVKFVDFVWTSMMSQRTSTCLSANRGTVGIHPWSRITCKAKAMLLIRLAQTTNCSFVWIYGLKMGVPSTPKGPELGQSAIPRKHAPPILLDDSQWEAVLNTCEGWPKSCRAENVWNVEVH